VDIRAVINDISSSSSSSTWKGLEVFPPHLVATNLSFVAGGSRDNDCFSSPYAMPSIPESGNGYEDGVISEGAENVVSVGEANTSRS